MMAEYDDDIGWLTFQLRPGPPTLSPPLTAARAVVPNRGGIPPQGGIS